MRPLGASTTGVQVISELHMATETVSVVVRDTSFEGGRHH